MTTADHQSTTQPRDGWVVLGMIVSATAATLSSFSGLHELARSAGWAAIMAPLLPLTVDAFAATATRIWLADTTRSLRAKRFARACAVGAILLSLTGNAVWHLIAANLLQVSWIIVLTVGAIPPVVLGLISHLAVLRTQMDTRTEERISTVLSPALPAVPEPTKPAAARQNPVGVVRPRPSPKRKVSVPRYADQDELMQAAQAANAAYQETHGKAITRDALRQQLRIGGERATALLRQLKEETSAAV